MRTYSFTLIAILSGLLLSCSTTGPPAVNGSASGDPEVLETCRYWADEAYKMARGRDKGSNGNAILEQLSRQPQTEAVFTAMNLLRLVYVFNGLTPEQLREVVKTDCMGVKGSPVELRI